MKLFNPTRLVLLLIFTAGILTNLHAQNGVAINSTGSNPDGKAMLDITSTSKGLLIPRVTSAQRFGIIANGTSSPNQNGLLVYDTDSSTFFYWQQNIVRWIPFGTKLNYNWPSAHGKGGSMMSNDGSGNMAWTQVGKIDFVSKPSPQTISTALSLSSTSSNDSVLFINLDSNATYTIEAFLIFSSSLTTAIPTIAFVTPSGANITFGANNASANITQTGNVVTSSATATSPLGLSGVNSDQFVHSQGMITTTGSGILQLRWAPTGMGDLIMQTNSYLKLTRTK